MMNSVSWTAFVEKPLWSLFNKNGKPSWMWDLLHCYSENKQQLNDEDARVSTISSFLDEIAFLYYQIDVLRSHVKLYEEERDSALFQLRRLEHPAPAKQPIGCLRVS